MLPHFLGGSSDEPTLMDVEIYIHEPPASASTQSADGSMPSYNESSFTNGFGIVGIEDIRKATSGRATEYARAGRVVVPVLSRLSQRSRMFQLGAYPGVEYRILRIIDPESDKDIFYTRPGADYEIKPIYPLVPGLERQWPVRVNEKDIPRLYTQHMYNVISAGGSLFAAFTGLLMAFLLSQAISLFFIPSLSMSPTLLKGDVLLVEKVSPRIFNHYEANNIVLFHPPMELKTIVQRSGGRVNDRDLFVKRIAALPGDKVSVNNAGAVTVNNEIAKGQDLCETEPLRLIEKYIKPVSELEIQKGDVFVLGDCSSVSIDSRVWGPLSRHEIVGRPMARIWPLSRFGVLPSLPKSDIPQ